MKLSQKLFVLHTIEVKQREKHATARKTIRKTRQKWKNPFFFFFFSLSATAAPVLLTDAELVAYSEVGLCLESFPLRADEPESFGTVSVGRCGGTGSGVKYFWS
jgi:hypothetical protein